VDIKPIETKYKGYHFRSRLEARWAVFFDALGLQWEYEKEGFYIDDIMYLPDFFVISEDGDGWFVEVKGDMTDTNSINKVKYLDNNPPPYALGCFLVGQIEYPSKSLNPAEFNHVSLICQILLKKYSKNRIDLAVEKARSARFEHGR
jgi:hypothetical protein